MVWRWVVWACVSGVWLGEQGEWEGGGREGGGETGGLCVSFFVRREAELLESCL